MPIEHHSLLSDRFTAAVVTPEGRIVWHCVPRIDSFPLFAELVGGPGTGYWDITPLAGDGVPSQRYVGHSLVLETSWTNASVNVKVTDFLDCSHLVAGSSGARLQRPVASRLVRVVSGTASVRVEFAPRLGITGTRLRRDRSSLRCETSSIKDVSLWPRVELRSPDLGWHLTSDGSNDTAFAEVELKSQPLALELICYNESSNAIPASRSRAESRPMQPTWGSDAPPQLNAAQRHSMTQSHWEHWASQLKLPPLHTEMVRRSALTLKALCHEPTGAIVAAPTTSLPECIGGIRNWDYRFCWIRDASMTAIALIRLGSLGEAVALLDWLVRLVDRKQARLDQLKPLYAVDGEALPAETEIAGFVGYRGSRPVRIGNSAEDQLQTDALGWVMELIWWLDRAGGKLTRHHAKLVQHIVEAVRNNWQQPDQGMWEIRAPARHHVHSKVMCWLAVHRAMSLAPKLWGHRIPDWARLRDEIAAEVLELGWNPRIEAFSVAYDSNELDASVLMIARCGMLASDDPRLHKTINSIEAELRDGVALYRYRCDDGLVGAEGGFLLMTSWLIDARIAIGQVEEAARLLDDLIALAGPTQLMSEEYDPSEGVALGNFPQAYTHIGVIENAVNLAAAQASLNRD